MLVKGRSTISSPFAYSSSQSSHNNDVGFLYSGVTGAMVDLYTLLNVVLLLHCDDGLRLRRCRRCRRCRSCRSCRRCRSGYVDVVRRLHLLLRSRTHWATSFSSRLHLGLRWRRHWGFDYNLRLGLLRLGLPLGLLDNGGICFLGLGLLPGQHHVPIRDDCS
jgi:hypothetical protein